MIENLLAERMGRLGTETAFEVLARAKALEAKGHSVVHLEIGEPDFDTPRHVIDAAIDALNRGYTHYTASNGMIELRQAIASYITNAKNVPSTPDEVVVTPGAKPIMFYAILALVNAGDEVIYPNPGFPIYESVIEFVGGKAVPIPLREENDFRLDVDELAKLITPKTKMLIINTPQNPTGGVLTRADIEKIADLVRGKGIIVLSDEVYDRVLYEGEAFSIASLPGMKEQTILLDGFSKTYAMTGWRLGYGVMPVALAARISKLMVNSNSCTNAATQLAGVAALTGPQDAVVSMVAEFKRRRDAIVAGLNAIPGITCRSPKGAFYVFPNIKSLGKSSKEVADYLLNEANVAALAGTAFGAYGEGYLRLSYANSLENINEALNRIDSAIRKLK